MPYRGYIGIIKQFGRRRRDSAGDMDWNVWHKHLVFSAPLRLLKTVHFKTYLSLRTRDLPISLTSGAGQHSEKHSNKYVFAIRHKMQRCGLYCLLVIKSYAGAYHSRSVRIYQDNVQWVSSLTLSEILRAKILLNKRDLKLNFTDYRDISLAPCVCSTTVVVPRTVWAPNTWPDNLKLLGNPTL